MRALLRRLTHCMYHRLRRLRYSVNMFNLPDRISQWDQGERVPHVSV